MKTMKSNKFDRFHWVLIIVVNPNEVLENEKNSDDQRCRITLLSLWHADTHLNLRPICKIIYLDSHFTEEIRPVSVPNRPDIAAVKTLLQDCAKIQDLKVNLQILENIPVMVPKVSIHFLTFLEIKRILNALIRFRSNLMKSTVGLLCAILQMFSLKIQTTSAKNA